MASIVRRFLTSTCSALSWQKLTWQYSTFLRDKFETIDSQTFPYSCDCCCQQASPQHIMELKAGVQNYEWGKIGSASEVARLYKYSMLESEEFDESKPYAELWMGTHPNCPTLVKSTMMELSCYLQNHREALGEKSIKEFGADLPFLFKVLSVNKALSIQAHPNKAHAQELHQARPTHYKDPNHKPELAIALTEFKAMCGFRPYDEIQNNFKAVPELEDVIGADYQKFVDHKDPNTMEPLLKQCFHSMMLGKPEVITEALTTIIPRLEGALQSSNKGNKSNKSKKENEELYSTIKKLYAQFPDDVGCFGPVFFNLITLKPGEAIFLNANEPHAYLEGDCVECMACSDNVVRAGLTPKFKDVEVLCEMLNYQGAPATAKLFEPLQENESTQIFRPPITDFAVAVTKIAKGQTGKLVRRDVASIVIVTQGFAHMHDDTVLTSGAVLFVGANEDVGVVDVVEDFVCYIGLANL